MTRRRRLLIVLLAALPGLIALYALAALVLGLLPRNLDFRPAGDDGITIYLSSNGVHADLLLPLQSQAGDWRALLPATDFRNPPAADSYLAIGWGDRDFYLNTPTWAELKASTALRALSGQDGSLLHVEPLPPPRPAPDLRAIRISPAQLQKLDAYILRSFTLDTAGHAQPVAGAHYYAHDAFYVAHGRYSLLCTCNEWARAGLAEAGIRTAWWSPLPFGLFHQLPQ